MNQAGEGRKAGAVILNERLQRETLPSRNSLRVPGKHSCFYSLQGIFTRNKMLLCFVLFSLEMGFRCNTRIRISPSLAFWAISSGKAAGVGTWILIWISSLSYELRVCLEGGLVWCQPLHAGKHGGWQIQSKKPQIRQLNMATDLSSSWTLRHWK